MDENYTFISMTLNKTSDSGTVTSFRDQTMLREWRLNIKSKRKRDEFTLDSSLGRSTVSVALHFQSKRQSGNFRLCI